jgi:hypothetical protein
MDHSHLISSSVSRYEPIRTAEERSSPPMANESVRGSLRSGRAPRDKRKRNEDTHPEFFEGLVPGSSARKEDSMGSTREIAACVSGRSKRMARA